MSSKKRGANGGGSIRQRADGTWEARITLGTNPGTGKPVRKSIYGKTQKEIRQKMQKALVEVDEGIYTEQSKITLKQWMETWLAEFTGAVKDSTRTSYRQHMNNHIIPALGAVKLSELTPAACQKFINDLSRVKGLSAKTVKNVHGVLHHALKQAVRLGYMRMNPTEACTLPRIEKAKIEPLDTPEIKRLLDVLGDDVYSDLLRVDIFTGMREGEILGLQWSCVDFDRGTITIEKQLSRPRVKGEEYRFTSLKNDKPRTVQPAPFVMQILKRQRRRQAEQRIQVGGAWDDCGFPDLVFTSETGKYLNYTIVLRHLKKALEVAGLPEKRFHDLRHTYAVSSLQAGDDVKTVQENLGHHTAAFTLDQYGHVTESMRQASAQRMEAFINGLNM
ncbi:MAG: site-specific integrase [Oscillospiraceae bacterium]|nr:site-specific integrase [Oscillospiraceae bacterium]